MTDPNSYGLGVKGGREGGVSGWGRGWGGEHYLEVSGL